MSAELIVLRAFVEDPAVAKEMVARGFAAELLPTREGREVAQALLDMQANGSADLEALKAALGARGTAPCPAQEVPGRTGEDAALFQF